MSAYITLKFDVQDVDPTLVDPNEIADYLFGLYDADVKANKPRYELAQGFLEAEWEDA